MNLLLLTVLFTLLPTGAQEGHELVFTLDSDESKVCVLRADSDSAVVAVGENSKNFTVVSLDSGTVTLSGGKTLFLPSWGGKPRVRSSGGKLELQVKDADVVSTLDKLCRRDGKASLFDHEVMGKLTLSLGEMSAEDALFEVLDTQSGLAMGVSGDNYFFEPDAKSGGLARHLRGEFGPMVSVDGEGVSIADTTEAIAKCMKRRVWLSESARNSKLEWRGSLLNVQADAALRAILYAAGSEFEVEVTDEAVSVGTTSELKSKS